MVPDNLTTPAFALLAFLIAFYTLLARERKTPYIITYIYPVAALAVLAVLLSSVAPLFSVLAPRFRGFLAWAAFTALLLAVVYVIFNMARLYNRHVHFRDDNLIKNSRTVRALRHRWRRLREKPSYAHSSVKISYETLRAALVGSGKVGLDQLCGSVPSSGTTRALSVSICRRRLQETDNIVKRLAEHLLNEGWNVQYATCIRHPFELVEKLNVPTDGRQRVVVIDGYTPHFGFADSTHREHTANLGLDGYHLVTSNPSYAGVHTAAAKAWNKLKKNSASNTRKPTLVIYEGCHALIDLESAEQYRIFVRHVLPSERAFGGMLTLFIEPTISDPDLALLETYSDCFLGPSSASPAKESLRA